MLDAIWDDVYQLFTLGIVATKIMIQLPVAND